MNEFTRKMGSFLGSRRFYWAVVAFFVIEALWIVFSANYPMAFDEDFHFGVIKVYSQHWLPFLAGQPQGANAYGALAADPSYLYHYLMSFPYRLLALVTHSQAAQVIFLRLINVGLITGGIVLFGKVLRRAGASSLLTNVSTLLFVLIPTVPMLGGQINYDNLLLLSLAWVCWLVLKITEDFRAHRINIATLIWLAVSLMAASLVKYAFLPLALAVVAYLVVWGWINLRSRPRVLLAALKTSYIGLSKGAKAALLVALIVSGGLLMQRYGTNAIRYGNPVPSCDKVIGVEACMEYGPWARNYRFAAAKPEHINTSPVAYTWQWLQGLHYRLFFVIAGPPEYTNYPPALLPSVAAILIAVSGVVSLLFYWRRVFGGHPFLVFLLLMSAVYGAILWSQNYAQYVQTGQPVAINGRYLIPLLFPLAAVLGRGLGVAFSDVRIPAKTWAAAFVILLFLQGGGVISFIMRSDSAWYWSNSFVVNANETVQKAIHPIIFIGPKHY